MCILDSLSLDGKSFAMTYSSNSQVDPQNMSHFNYSEVEGVVWGDFAGGVVQTGQFVGVRDGETLRTSFAYRTHQGELVMGEAESVIVVTPSGLRLDERFIGPDGKQHTSVCEQRINR